MTTIISGLYEDANTAHSIVTELEAAGFASDSCGVVTQTGDASVLERLMEARVDEHSAQAYAQHMTTERAIVIVHAGFNPFGTALRAIQILNGYSWVEAGAPHPDRYVREEASRVQRLSVMRTPRRFLSPDMEPGLKRRSTLSAMFAFPLLKKRKTSNSAISGGRLVSGGWLPFPTLIQKDKTNSATPGGGHPFSKFFKMQLLSPRAGS